MEEKGHLSLPLWLVAYKWSPYRVSELSAHGLGLLAIPALGKGRCHFRTTPTAGLKMGHG